MKSPENSQKITRLAMAGVMIALAFIFSYLESLLPSFTGIPGVKIGLANIATMVALYTLGLRYAIVIAIVRVILSGLTFTGLGAMLYGLAGTTLSLLVMLLLKSLKNASGSSVFSPTIISAAGGVAHNAGQLLVARAVLGSAVLYYLPVLIISGLIAGFITGIILFTLLRSMHR